MLFWLHPFLFTFFIGGSRSFEVKHHFWITSVTRTLSSAFPIWNWRGSGQARIRHNSFPCTPSGTFTSVSPFSFHTRAYTRTHRHTHTQTYENVHALPFVSFLLANRISIETRGTSRNATFSNREVTIVTAVEVEEEESREEIEQNRRNSSRWCRNRRRERRRYECPVPKIDFGTRSYNTEDSF